MSLQQLITDYGYLAILMGTFLEGETILILGGFASHRGYLELPWVVVSAFIGTLAGDQLPLLCQLLFTAPVQTSAVLIKV